MTPAPAERRATITDVEVPPRPLGARAVAWHRRQDDRAGELATDPDLTRAACKGMDPLHDLGLHGEPLEAQQERHRRAIAVCRSCPVSAACAAVAEALPAPLRRGVWAGVVHGLPGRTGDGHGSRPPAPARHPRA